MNAMRPDAGSGQDPFGAESQGEAVRPAAERLVVPELNPFEIAQHQLSLAADASGIDLRGATVAIQGFGKAGRFAHKLALKLLGAKVVAVSHSRGGAYNAEGPLSSLTFCATLAA
jgi:lactate dehydrogenase-like 2-hydroxyacid dehydrogenase